MRPAVANIHVENEIENEPEEEEHVEQESELDLESDIEDIIKEVNKMSLNHPALVNAVLKEEESQNICAICEGSHPTIDCEYISRSNISPVILRKTNQWRLKLKKLVLEKEAKANMTRNPNPYRGTIQRNQGFEKPKVATLTVEQIKSFKEETAALEDENHEEYYEPHVMSVQERENIDSIEGNLKAMFGDEDDCATPIVATQQPSRQTSSNEDTGENYIPVHAEFEEPLNPNDYMAYNGAVNW